MLSAGQVLSAPRPWPSARVLPNDSPPEILAVSLNETTIADGDRLIGRVATSTNVASLEVRTESFSFNAQRPAFGEFTFVQHVLDMPPEYRRRYLLEFIARNSAGMQARRYVPIRFR